MITTTFFVVLTINSVHSQINGEFWWLDKKLTSFRNAEPAEPVIEVLSDFDNDESAKIVFRDHDDLFTNELTKPLSNRRDKPRIYDHTNNKIVWPINKSHNDIAYNKAKEITNIRKPKNENSKVDDEFVFNFPYNERYSSNHTINSTEKVPQATKKTENDINDDKSPGTNEDKEAQNICTYMKKKECFLSKGIIYVEWNQKKPYDQETVCCILPIQPIPKADLTSIYFPGATNRKPRHKRSEENKGLNQRNLLLLRKFSHPRIQAATPKIVTPAEDDYVDPYWNIKNSKFLSQFNQKIVTPSYNYDSHDYGDYASELPRPGLIGLYSDHVKSPSSWSFTSDPGFVYGGEPEPADDYEEDDVEDDAFGYSTIDPRKVSGAKKQKGKPVKFTTVSDEVTLNAESHTINFQSNPDFQVLQGFKLLNLFRNRSRIHTKKSRQTTTERIDDSKEFLGAPPEESSEVGDDFFEEDQLFGGCGKAAAINAKDKDKVLSDAASGSHPWLALVVLTKRRQNVLCYATLIHPRAALTVADCVHGTMPRDITVIAGAWDLNERTRLKNRVADIQVHPKYKSGDNDNNLAVLYWMRPLQLGTNTQPACLGEPHVGDECRFFGWGNLDQGIQTRSRWQRASIRMCDPRIIKLTKQSETFCASVSRGSVTGLGGPLICEVDRHFSVVGIIVSVDKGYALMPVREFAMKANELLSGD